MRIASDKTRKKRRRFSVCLSMIATFVHMLAPVLCYPAIKWRLIRGDLVILRYCTCNVHFTSISIILKAFNIFYRRSAFLKTTFVKTAKTISDKQIIICRLYFKEIKRFYTMHGHLYKNINKYESNNSKLYSHIYFS